MPGHCATVDTADLAIEVGKVTGRWPDGSTSPVSTAAMAAPSSSPGYQSSTTARTLESQGMTTGPSVLRTTMVRGLAAATAEIRVFWSPGSSRLGRSKVSAV